MAYGTLLDHLLLTLMGLPLTPMVEMLGKNLKGMPTMINSYMTWDWWRTSVPLCC